MATMALVAAATRRRSGSAMVTQRRRRARGRKAGLATKKSRRARRWHPAQARTAMLMMTPAMPWVRQRVAAAGAAAAVPVAVGELPAAPGAAGAAPRAAAGPAAAGAGAVAPAAAPAAAGGGRTSRTMPMRWFRARSCGSGWARRQRRGRGCR